MQAVIPTPAIASLLQKSYVALAADCDDPEPEVRDLAMHMVHATTLPFVMLADADGKFVAGSAGRVDPEALRKLLEQHAGA